MKYLPTKEFFKPKLLLGEGIDEWFTFRALLMQSELDQTIDVEQYGGKNLISEGLKAITRRPGFVNINSVAITRDADFIGEQPADQVVNAAFQSVCSALQNAGLPVPGKPFVIEQTTYQDREFRIGAFILPGPRRCGMLEDLCLDAASDDPTLTCVDALWSCIADKHPDGCRTHSKEKLPKARIHAWLATLQKPDCRLGEAALSGDIDFNHAAFSEFKAFVRQL